MDLAQRFDQLTDLLTAEPRLWCERPFTGLPLGWEADHPDLSKALRGLTKEQVEAYQRDPTAWLDAPAEFSDLVTQLGRAIAWPALSARSILPGPRPRQIPQRKWDQITAFSAALLRRRPARVETWLEWCAGKGHLARLLGKATDLPVRGVELQARLCEEGHRLAAQEGVQARFTPADVLIDAPAVPLGPSTAAVALHACGELHARLLTRAVQSGCGLVAVAPCCYHRHGPKQFAPLSQAGRDADLVLEQHHLRMVGFDEVVASPGRRARRQKEEIWRLGLDLLLREVTGLDEYRPLGPIPTDWLDGTFQAFCRRMANREGIDLPDDLVAGPWERHGAQRRHLTRALGTIRSLFRRPLESWLFCDRVAFMAEAGYRVEAGTFCDRRVTPRNLLLVATPKA